MFRQGRLAVHGLAILLGRIEAGMSNGEIFLHHAVVRRGPGQPNVQTNDMWVTCCFPHLVRLIILIILPCGVSATHPQK